MKYTEGEFGIALLKKINKKSFNIDEIALWCRRLYDENAENSKLYQLLFSLSTMNDDPHFEYSVLELEDLAKNLIFSSDEFTPFSPLPNLNKTIYPVIENWFYCPTCQQTWEENKETPLIICPKCSEKFWFFRNDSE